MKIAVITHALDEDRNIRRFCEGYSFADKIIITDGGSQDKTRDIASQFDNTVIVDVSDLQVELPGDPYHDYSTPVAPQINISLKWAKQYGADWVIRDDCDSWPNELLKESARQLLEETGEKAVFVHHLYIWGQHHYFPKMNEPGPGLWAWQPAHVDIYADETVSFVAGLRNVPEDGLKIHFPLALLHYFAPDEETVQRKAARKQARGDTVIHPLDSIYAPPEPLPEWAV